MCLSLLSENSASQRVYKAPTIRTRYPTPLPKPFVQPRPDRPNSHTGSFTRLDNVGGWIPNHSFGNLHPSQVQFIHPSVTSSVMSHHVHYPPTFVSGVFGPVDSHTGPVPMLLPQMLPGYPASGLGYGLHHHPGELWQWVPSHANSVAGPVQPIPLSSRHDQHVQEPQQQHGRPSPFVYQAVNEPLRRPALQPHAMSTPPLAIATSSQAPHRRLAKRPGRRRSSTDRYDPLAMNTRGTGEHEPVTHDHLDALGLPSPATAAATASQVQSNFPSLQNGSRRPSVHKRSRTCGSMRDVVDTAVTRPSPRPKNPLSLPLLIQRQRSRRSTPAAAVMPTMRVSTASKSPAHSPNTARGSLVQPRTSDLTSVNQRFAGLLNLALPAVGQQSGSVQPRCEEYMGPVPLDTPQSVNPSPSGDGKSKHKMQLDHLMS